MIIQWAEKRMRRKYSALSELPNLFITARKRSLGQGNVSQTSFILFTGGVPGQRTSWTDTPHTENPLDRDPLDRDPWTETPWTETPCKERVVCILLECILVWFLIGSLWQRDRDRYSYQIESIVPCSHWLEAGTRTRTHCFTTLVTIPLPYSVNKL